MGLLIRTFWLDRPFNLDLYIIGTIGGIFNTIGIVFLNRAISSGPIGEVSALSSIQTILFTAVQAFILMKVPEPLQFVGMAIGIFGALVLTIPEQL